MQRCKKVSAGVVFAFLVGLGLILNGPRLAAQSGGGTQAPATVTLMVKLAASMSAADRQALMTRYGATVKSDINKLGIEVVEIPADTAATAEPNLRLEPGVLRVEESKTRRVQAFPNDAQVGSQWALPQIAWDQVYGTVTPQFLTKVAILDTGVDATHPDLMGSLAPGTSIIDGSNGLTDLNGHGTWLAGIVAARTNNIDGIAGVGYQNVQVMPVKVIDANGDAQDDDVISGVMWAADNGASVILMAFSNTGFSASLQDAIDYAWANNVVLVAAVGNDGSSVATFPAGDRGVMGVSATDQSDNLASGSNYGGSVFIAAPGVSILGTGLNNTYVAFSGTSASAAIVAGAAALMRAVDPTLSNGVVVNRIARNADPAGTQAQTGNGRLQIARAIADTDTTSIQPAGTAPVGGGGPFVGPYHIAGTANDGAGTMTVAPTPATTVAGSTGNSFTFTFAADNGKDFNAGSQVTLLVPAGWTAPQSTTSGNPGFVSVAVGTCTAATLAPITGAGPWTIPVNMTCSGGKSFTLTYAGGGTKVTAPSTAGVNTFTTQTKQNGGTLTTITSGSPTVTVTAGAANKLAFTTSPSNSTGGVAFGTQPIVTLQDQFGNTVTGTAQNVTVAIQNNAGPGGVLSGTTTVAVNTTTGLANFVSSGLSIDKAGTGYTLTATGSTVSTTPGVVLSNAFNITAGTATKVRVETAADGSGTVVPAQSVAAGSSITVFSITRDAGNNFVANAPATTWSLTGITGGVVAGDLVPSGDKKSAVFTGHLVGTAVIHDVITGVATSVDSGTITVTAGAAAKLAFTAQPSASTAAGTAFAAQPVVTVQDAGGNTITTSTDTITLSITAGTPLTGGPGTVTCTTNPITLIVANAGVATFAGCKVNNIGTGYKLHAASGSLTAADSNAFDITKRPITVTALTNTKTYDGTTSATATPTIAPALLAGDTSNFTETYDTRNFGTNKTLTPAGTVTDGNGGNNYTITFVTNTTGVINKLAITVSAVTDTKTYDGTTSSTGTPTFVPALASGDTTTTFTQAFSDRNAGTGNKTLTPSGLVNDGNSGLNYSYTYTPFTTGTINKLGITVTAVTDSKVYNGTTTSTGTPTFAPALATGDTTTTFSQAFSTKDAGIGNKTLVPSGIVNDGNSGNNYAYTFNNFTTGTITAKALTVAGSTAAAKIYDGTTNETLGGAPVLLATEAAGAGTTADGKPYSVDSVTTGGTAAGAFADRNVGVNKAVTVSGVTITGTGSGNYTATQQTGLQANITAKALTYSGLSVPASKIYDGTTAAVVSGTAVLQATETEGTGTAGDGMPYGVDSVSLTGTASGTYNSKDVAAATTVTFGGVSLTGTGNGNYTLTASTQAATITKKALTQSGLSVPSSKIYDGTTAAVVSGTAALQGTETAGTGTTADGKPYSGDTVSLTGTASGTYDSKDVATATTVTFAGVSLTGAQAGDYSLTIQSPAAATITAKALAIVGSTASAKVYDGTATETLGGAPALQAAETAGTGTTADGKPYSVDSVTTGGTAAGNFADRNVGVAKPVTVSGVTITGTGSGNYTATQQTGLTANITAKALTYSGLTAAASKVYDGTVSAVVSGTAVLQSAEATGVGSTSDGIPYTGNGDTVSLTGTATGAYNTKDVATANLVTFGGVSLTGTGNGNYTLTASTQAATITVKTLTMGGLSVPASKIYNGNTTAVVSGSPGTLQTAEAGGSGTTADGKPYSGDTVSLTGTATGTYDSKDVATATTVTFAGVSLTGAQAGDYSLTIQSPAAATITAKTLTASITGNPTKPYDGNTNATLTAANFSLSGLVGSESFTVTKTTGTYNSKDVATATTVTATLAGGDFTPANGAVASNYTLPTTASGPGTITAKTLTAAIIGNPTKPYDGNTTATLTSANFSLSGLIGTETFTVTQTSGTYNSPDASTATTVTANLAAGDFTPANGAVAGDYTLPTTASGPGQITKVTPIFSPALSSPAAIPYGTATVSLPPVSVMVKTVGGIRAGSPDTVTITINAVSSGPIGFNGASGTFGAINFDTHTIPVGSYTITYAYSGGINFNAISDTSTTLTVTAKTLTAAIIGNPTKPYDSNTNATLTSANFSLTGLVGTDSFTVTKTTGSYNSANVATATTVTTALAAGDFTPVGGTLASNYTLPTTASGAGHITAKTLTAAIIGNPTKPYDGNANATLTSANFSLTGLAGTDSFTVTKTTGTYNSANVATAATVSTTLLATDFTPVGGTLAGNYTLPTTASGPGSITAINATIVVTPYSVIYNAAAHTATGTATGVGGADLSAGLNFAGTTHTNAGTYSSDFWSFTDATGNYNNVGNTTITDSIAQATASITVTAYSVTYDGNPHTATGTATGVASVNLSAGLNLSGTTHTNAGTYNSDAWSFHDAGGNYADANSTVNDAIAKAVASVVVSGFTGTYNGAAHAATAVITGVDAGGAALGSTFNAGSSFTNVPGGTANWTFTGGANYTDQSGSASIVINKANATVVVTPYSVTYDGQPHTATVASITGVNSETGSTVGTVNVSNTTRTNVGTYSVDYWTFTGAANYNDISAHQTITDTIAKANATVVVTPYSVTYDGNPHTATVASITGVNSETGSTVGTVDVSNTTHTTVGTYSSDYWTFAGAANYNDISAHQTITDTITKAPVTVTFTASNKNYDTTNTAAVSACVIATGKVGSDDVSCTVSGGTFASANAGTQTVSATAALGGAAAGNYSVTNPVTTTATINQITPVFSGLSSPIIVYGTGFTPLGGTILSGSLAPSGSVSITLTSVGIQPAPITAGTGAFSSSFTTGGLVAGTYAITYHYAGDTNFTAAVDGAGLLTVIAPDLTAVKADSVSNATTLGNTWDWTITVTNSGNAPAMFADGQTLLTDNLPDTNVSYGAASVLNATTVTNNDKIICSIDGSKNLACVATGAAVTMGAGSSFQVKVTATPSAIGIFANPRNSLVCAVDPNSDILESNESNNNCSDTVTVTAPDLTATKTNNVGGTTTYGNTWDWTIAVANAGNADATFTDGQTILVDNLPSDHITYGSPVVLPPNNPSDLTGAVLCGISGNILTCKASGGSVILPKTTGHFGVQFPATATAVGTYNNPTGGVCAVDSDHHVAESDETNNACSDTVKVTPALLTITAKDESKTYGATFAPNGATQFTTTGTLFNGDAVTSVTLTSSGYAGTATVTTPGPTYSIVPSAAAGTGLGNYSISYTNGTFTVNPAPLTVTAKDESKTYGATFTPDGATQFTTTGTLYNSDTVTSVTLTSSGYAGTATVTTPGPSYSIVPSAAAGSGVGNYSISYTNGTFTVNPAPLTVTAKDESKTYGATFTPDGTTQFTTTGTLFNGDTVASVVLTSSGYAGTATVTAPGPTYSIVPSAATGSGVGNYSITYTNGTFTVNPAPLTITAKNESKTYGATFTSDGATQFTVATLFNGDTVASVVLTSSGYAGTATVTTPGPTYSIVPSAAAGSGLGNYSISYTNGTFTVNPAPLTVTAKNESKTYGATFTPDGATQFTAATLFNGDAVTSVTLTSSGYAGTATVTTPGPTYSIVPSAAAGTGLGNYSISYTNGTFTVNPAPLTVTAKDESKTYGATFTPDGATQFTTTGTLYNSDTVTSVTLTSSGYAGTATVTTPGPSYSIVPSAAAGSGVGNYSISYTNGTFTVNPAPLTVTAKDESKTYGATFTPDGTTQFTTTGTLFNGDTVASVVLTSSGYAGTATVTAPGPTYSIVPSAATGSGVGSYSITYTNGTFTVNPAPLTITAKNESKTYGATFTSDGATQFTVATLFNGDTVASVVLTSSGYAGTATVTTPGPTYSIVPSAAAGSGLGNYSISYTNGTFTVNPAPLTVTAKNESKTYGATFTPDGATQFTAATLFNGDAVTSVTLTSSGYAGTATVTTPGPTYSIVPSAAAGTGLGNYSISYTNGTFTVNPAPLTVTAKDESKTYGATFTPDGATQFTTTGTLYNSDTVTSVTLTSSGYAGTATVTTPGPSYSIVPSAAAGSGVGNYSISYTNGTFTVNPAPLTVTAKDESKTYGATFTPDGTTQFTTTGTLYNSDAVTSVTLMSSGYAGTATVTAPGPTYSIVPSAATGSGVGNYSITYTNGTFTVNPAPLTITAKNESKTYGATFTSDGATQFTVATLFNGDTVASVVLTSSGYAGTATVTTPGPTYSIVPSAAAGTGLGNYSISYTNGTFTVNPALLTVTAKDQSKTYGATFTPDGATQFTAATLFNGDAVTSVTLTSSGYAGTATVTAPGPSYSIVPSAAAGTGLGNYSISYTNGTFTVNPALLTVTAKNQSKNYGTTFSFTGTEFTTTGTLYNGDTVTSVTLTSAGAAGTATVTSPGPSYSIVPSAAAGSGVGNYTISYINGTFTVNPVPLTVTAKDESKTYGATFTPNGTTQFTTTGTLYNSDTVTSVTLTSTGYAGTATVTAPGPTYSIVPSAATGIGVGNYTISYVNGTLTVTKAPLAITSKNETKIFGATFTPDGTTQFTAVTLYNSDTVTSVTLTSTGYAAAAPAGPPGPTYVITPSAAVGTGLGNYTTSYVNGVLTVIDTTAPVVSNVTLSAYAVPMGSTTPVTLTANVSDVTTGNSNISSAHYNVNGGPWLSMTTSPASSPNVTATASLGGALFSSTAVLNICVTGTDAANNTSAATTTCAILAVYDPSAGFVTGGGWIISPINALYPQYMSKSGKANFGFVSQYHKGATVPTGNSQFQFQEGNLDFESTSYQWLVVSGSKAQYQGTGTINGQGNYGFQIFAYDGSIKGNPTSMDGFRIQIGTLTSDGTIINIVYDNVFTGQLSPGSGTEPLDKTNGNGSIQIHSN